MKAEELYIKKLTLNRLGDINWKKYPFNIPVIKKLKTMVFRKPVTIIVAENGMGKSTILEAIAVKYGFNPEGGSRNFNFSTYESHSDLDKYITLTKSHIKAKDGYFFRAESFYNVASEIERLDGGKYGELITRYYGGLPLHDMSHGESFFALLNNRLGGNGLYLLDEPEASLSPSRQLSLLIIMNQLVKAKSQFIICTHSPIIMGFPNADIYEITENGLELTEYENLNQYQIMKSFLNNRERILKELEITNTGES